MRTQEISVQALHTSNGLPPKQDLAIGNVVRALRILTILAVAVTSAAAAQAQNDPDDKQDSNFKTACADVKPPAVNSQQKFDNVPVYVISPEASGHRAECRALEALSEGMVDVELGDDRVLDEALGDPVPDAVTGEMSKFPYSEPGSRPTPGLPPPGPSAEAIDHSHAYAAFVDPATGVEYTFSSAAENLADAEQAGAAWIRSTVEPLLKQHAAKASAPVAANSTSVADAASIAADFTNAAADAAEPPPTYMLRAWTLLLVETITLPNNEFAGGVAAGFRRRTGRSTAVVKFYRLNANLSANGVDSDVFLVDTAYTQTPSYDPFNDGIRLNGVFWVNKQTQFKLRSVDPYHSSIKPSLSDFAPKTVVSSSEQTFTVGAKLSADLKGPSGDLTADYSVTRNQLDVETVVNAGFGDPNLTWTDTYNGFGGGKYPATLTNTFTGERLAIFTVPRTVNDVAPNQWAGLEFTPFLYSQVQGFFTTFLNAHKNFEYADWQLTKGIFVAEPRFSVHAVPPGAPIYPQGSPHPPLDPDGPPLQISLSKTNITNPVYVDVVAQLPNGAEKVTWLATTKMLVATDVGPDRTGSARIKIYPAPGAAVNNSGYIFVDSVASRATDSLRRGAIRIPVMITP